MSTILLLSLMGTFAAVALLSGAVAYTVLERQAPGRKRLHEVVAGRRVAAPPPPPASLTLTDRPHRLVERIASFVPKSPVEMSKLRRRLVRAGYHSLTAAVVFSIAEFALPVVLGLPPERFTCSVVAFDLGKNWRAGTRVTLLGCRSD